MMLPKDDTKWTLPNITIAGIAGYTLRANLTLGDMTKPGPYKLVGTHAERTTVDGRDGIDVTIRWEKQ